MDLNMSIGSIVQRYVEGFEESSELSKSEVVGTVQVDWNDFEPNQEEIGHGTYCIVNKVTLKGEATPYALKFLNNEWKNVNEKRYEQGAKDVALEGKLLERLRHPNIISLRGCRAGEISQCLDDARVPYFLLLEYLPDTLGHILEQNRRASVITRRSMRSKVKLFGRIEHCALGIAKAMEYLHGHGVIFRDLKPSNVGFDKDGQVKLFDFGNARELAYSTKTGEHLGFAGTPRYMATEVGTGQDYGLPSDVYSFGILLWEICAVAIPFESIHSLEDFKIQVFMQHKRPDLNLVKSTQLKNLIAQCWDPNPILRPTFPQVRQSLEWILTQHQQQMAPSRFKSRRNSSGVARRFSMGGMFSSSSSEFAQQEDNSQHVAVETKANLDSARAA